MRFHLLALSNNRLMRLTFLIVFLAGAVIFSLASGRLEISLSQILNIMGSRLIPVEPTWSLTLDSVIMDVRLPRILAGMLVGAGLSLSGAAFQGVFRNPLVSPHILGVASGSGFGAALAILLFPRPLAIQLSSFAFGMIAVGLTYTLSRTYRLTPVLMMVLSGIVVGALFSALTSFLKYIADPMNKMPAIVFWLLGSLNHVSGKDLIIILPVNLIAMGILTAVRWRINLLAMGDEDAKTLGVNTEALKGIIIVCATVLTATAVSISGIIGWIGIVIPHMGRLIIGPDHTYLLPASAVIGASYLVLVDTLARSLLVTEIPIGILTAIIGAPIFALLLKKNQTGW